MSGKRLRSLASIGHMSQDGLVSRANRWTLSAPRPVIDMAGNIYTRIVPLHFARQLIKLRHVRIVRSTQIVRQNEPT
ncbi:hypothetical protein U91I_00556 [alpha proteobacterium U9-1i]|nr:hypothetical protein U91I_00556 [alpha proteobacterium U9-1i]